MAVRGLVPQTSTIEIELDAAQQQILHARRARLDVMTHVLTPIRE